MNEIDTLDTLKIENARLIALLEVNGIEWHLPVKSNSTATIDQQSSVLSTTTIDEPDTLLLNLLTRIPCM